MSSHRNTCFMLRTTLLKGLPISVYFYFCAAVPNTSSFVSDAKYIIANFTRILVINRIYLKIILAEDAESKSFNSYSLR